TGRSHRACRESGELQACGGTSGSKPVDVQNVSATSKKGAGEPRTLGGGTGYVKLGKHLPSKRNDLLDLFLEGHAGRVQQDRVGRLGQRGDRPAGIGVVPALEVALHLPQVLAFQSQLSRPATGPLRPVRG